RERGRCVRADPAVCRGYLDLHLSGLSLPCGGRADDELPPAAVDLVHAGQRAHGTGAHAGSLCARDRERISLLQLWRREPADPLKRRAKIRPLPMVRASGPPITEIGVAARLAIALRRAIFAGLWTIRFSISAVSRRLTRAARQRLQASTCRSARARYSRC